MSAGRRRNPSPGVVSPPRPGRQHPPRPVDAWTELTEEIEACTRCSLHRTRHHVVVYRGPRHPRVVFVGEAPGAAEDRQGVPFVGRSGRLLDASLAQVGLTPDAFGVVNLVKCRPPRNVFDPAAARTCRPYLDRQLSLLKPQRLVTLGARALAALDPTAPRILTCAGTPRRTPLGPLFPLVHPAASLRSTALAQRWRDDLVALGRWLREGPPAGRAIPS